MTQSDQLIIPEAAKLDHNSFELLRVWVANNNQHVSLRGGVWEDPAAWGLMLADLLKHIVTSYEQDVTFDRHQTLQRIKSAFDAELKFPTDACNGEAINGGRLN